MPKLALEFAVALILVGLLGYFGDSENQSITALIPAFFGIPLGICGLLALNEKLRIYAMHAAAFIGVLGTLAAGGRGVMSLVKLLSGDETVNTRALLFVWMMAILCFVFVFLCVQSFRKARQNREKGESSDTGKAVDG